MAKRSMQTTKSFPLHTCHPEAATDPQNCDTDDGAGSCLLDSEDSVNCTTARVDERD